MIKCDIPERSSVVKLGSLKRKSKTDFMRSVSEIFLNVVQSVLVIIREIDDKSSRVTPGSLRINFQTEIWRFVCGILPNSEEITTGAISISGNSSSGKTSLQMDL
jgi:hypothetical protein